MKLKTILALGLLSTTTLFSQTTMCFKENHSSMTTIETTPLDGGLCSSTKSLTDMKKEGWSVDDIKIEDSTNGKNYIYILKKESQTLSTMDEEKLEQRIMQKLQDRKVQEQAKKKKEALIQMSRSGKELYINKCQKCHGEKADINAYGASRKLIDLSLQDMQISIKEYSIGEYNRGKAFLMKPYAQIMSPRDVKNVYSYIKTLKPKKEEKKEEESSN